MLFDLWIESFFKQNPLIAEELTPLVKKLGEAFRKAVNITEVHTEAVKMVQEMKLQEKLEMFDQMNMKYPMYHWTRMYMDQVRNLLHFLRGV